MLKYHMSKAKKVLVPVFILLVALSTLFASLAFFTDRANKTTTIKISTFNDDGYSIEQLAPEGWFVAGETLEVQIKESNDKEENITSQITMNVVWDSPVPNIYPWGNSDNNSNAVIRIGDEIISYTADGDTITFTLPEKLLTAKTTGETLLEFQIPADLASTGRLYFSYEGIQLSQYPTGWTAAYTGTDLSDLAFDVGVVWNISDNQNTKDVIAYLTDGVTAGDSDYGLSIVKVGSDANTNKGVMMDWSGAGETPWSNYSITELSIGEGVTTIGDYAFAGETGITSVDIPSTVTDIGVSAFDGAGLTGTLTIPATVENIDRLAFGNLQAITIIEFGHSSSDSLTLPDNSVETTSGAFYAGSPYTPASPLGTTILSDNNDILNYNWTQDARGYTVTVKRATGVALTATPTVAIPGKTITLAPSASAGYEYTGAELSWSGGTKTLAATDTTFVMPAANVTVTPMASLITYAIHYELNGGELDDDVPTSYHVTDTVTLPEPTRPGYTFDGWYEDSSFSGNEVTEIAIGSTGDKTFYAKWTANTDTPYTVHHWQQNLIGTTEENSTNYTLKETDYLTGTTDSKVTPARKTYVGFTSPAGVEITIGGDGKTVLDYYYTRNSYTFTLGSCTGVNTSGSTASGIYRYGADINLKASISTGYTWNNWTSSNTSLVANKSSTSSTFTMPAGDLTMTPNATLDAYTITYVLNGGSLSADAPTSYHITTATFSLPTPTKLGYNFSAWYTSADFSGTTATQIVRGSTGNKTFYAKWTPKNDTAYTVYHWQQTLTGDTAQNSTNYKLIETENMHGTTDTDVTPPVKDYPGFTSPTPQTVTIAADGSTVVNYYYTRNSYTFTLGSCAGVNTSGSSPSGTYKYGATILLEAAISDGYLWIAWSSSNTALLEDLSATSTEFTMPAGDITMTPDATLVTYTITYEVNGGTLPSGATDSYNVTTATFSLPAPTKTGYTFGGWYENSGLTGTAVTQIVKGSTGDKTFYAKWIPNTNTVYTVNHYQQNITDDGYTLKETENKTGTTGVRVTPAVKTYTGFTSPSTQTVTIAADGSTVVDYYYTRNSYKFTLGTGTGVTTTGSTATGNYKYGATITLKATANTGYTWNTWTSSNTSLVANQSSASSTFNMPAGNIAMTPSATLNNYNINYELNGGTQGSGAVTSYNVTTATFSLPTPTKTGYTFGGWYENSGLSGSAVTQIVKGSTGDKTFYAKWTASTGTSYTVNHYQQNITDDGYTLKETENKTGTTGSSVTPAVKTYTGFTSPSTQTVTIAADGSTVVDYYYTRNSYTFTLKADAGVTTTGSSASGTYKYGATITLDASAKNGYTWNGWTSSNTSLVSTPTQARSTFYMPAGNITMTASASVINYDITYELNGGTQGSGAVGSYTVESSTITLPTPTKTGYAFAGWYENSDLSGSAVTQIVKGSTGDKTFYAKWTPNTNTAYTVKHYQQNITDEGYTLKETENKTGTTGASVTPAVKTYTGFTSPSTQTVTIAADGSTVVNYYYTRNSYTFTLGSCTGVSTSGSTASGTYRYGYSITLKATASTGYTWSKWTSNNTSLVANQTSASSTFTMPAGNIAMTPSATLNNYTITYVTNDGTLPSSAVTNYNVTTATFSLPTPTRTGYTFAGWYTSSTFSGSAVTQIAKGSTGNKTFYAKWSANIPILAAESTWFTRNSFSIDTEDVVTITFVDEVSDAVVAAAGESVWDASAETNGSVMAYAVSNGDGTYSITVAGNGYGKIFANTYSQCTFRMFTKVTSIDNLSLLDTQTATNMNSMFAYCLSLSSTPDTSTWDTSNVTSMNGMFFECNDMTEAPDTSGWNTSKVTNFGGMFYSCTTMVTTPDTSGWDTSQATDLACLFCYCHAMVNPPDTSKWDTSEVTEIYDMFFCCYALTAPPDTSDWDVSAITSTHGMFQSCFAMTSPPDTSKWVTSSLTDLSFMFTTCKEMTVAPDTSDWDTSLVTSTEGMFMGCYKMATPPDTSKWDTSSLAKTVNMFNSCYLMESAPIMTSWDTSSLTDMSQMFFRCELIPSLDVSSFDTRAITSPTDLNNFAAYCYNLTDITLGANFIQSYNVPEPGCYDLDTEMGGLFAVDGRSKGNPLRTTVSGANEVLLEYDWGEDWRGFLVEVISATGGSVTADKCPAINGTTITLTVAADDNYIYEGATVTYTEDGNEKVLSLNASTTSFTMLASDITITPAWTVDNIAFAIFCETDGSLTFYYGDVPETGTTYNNKTVTATYTGFDTETYDSSSEVPWIDVMSSIVSVSFSSEFAAVKPVSTAYWFRSASNLVTFNPANLDTSAVLTMARMFASCSSLTSLDLSSLNTSNVTSMFGMFKDCTGFTTLNVSVMDTSAVKTMGDMFSGCTNLQSVTMGGQFDTSSVIVMSNMFKKCSALTSLDFSSFSTASATTFQYMFHDCSSLSSLDLSSFRTANVTDMSFMFMGCSNLTSLDVSSFTTPKVTNMASMFRECSNITSLDLNGFTGNVVNNLSYMFNLCKSLQNLDLSGFNAAAVTTTERMFSTCTSLTSITFGSNFTMESVTNASAMFYRCSALTSLDLSMFSTANVQTFYSTFSDCTNLKTLTLSSNFKTSSATTLESMFSNCCSLTSLDTSSFTTPNATNISSLFYNCSSIPELDLSNFDTTSVTSATTLFTGMNSLKTVTLGSAFTFLGTSSYLPTPSSSYISGADGMWYHTTSGTGYTPAALATAHGGTIATYSAVPTTATTSTASISLEYVVDVEAEEPPSFTTETNDNPIDNTDSPSSSVPSGSANSLIAPAINQPAETVALPQAAEECIPIIAVPIVPIYFATA